MSAQAAITVENLTKTYGSVEALKGISFEVPRGEILGLLGPNGSGKTTTVTLLSTLQRPTAGSARIGGHDVVADAARVRELVSLTGQYASMDDSLTAVENLSVFGRLTGLRGAPLKARIGELIEQFDLHEVGSRRVGALSGGMRRRVDIASALITRPEVLFLDEPTTGLDPRSRAAVWDTVAGLRAEGITVLLTTQYLEEADRLADNIVMLDRGSVVASGTPGVLKQQAGAAVCEMTLVERGDTDRVIERLSGFEIIETPTDASAAHPRLVVRAPEGMATVHGVISRLQDSRIEVVDIGLRQPSLDEVFMQLTEKV
ncbi:daunorubicin resistance protein DrrA family ABC transporter ATP-binding protein [Gordonia soli]|uniref:Putative ABC transporter ATP-binding protein n=1 Tax=Gordonia soli NBRC 108243 TaxID=1223545 RepID=M0QPY7_9ACTN|nr:daunorubicin resistance protein DrrA family ABC transporter ATP-binding protein [Gordonia soli]GAC70643.1 putative ABC transporter ATP-binding protein [Gordonia soli NBRC 108243]